MPAVITRQRSLPVLLEVEGGNVGEIRIRDQPRAVLHAAAVTGDGAHNVGDASTALEACLYLRFQAAGGFVFAPVAAQIGSDFDVRLEFVNLVTHCAHVRSKAAGELYGIANVMSMDS